MNNFLTKMGVLNDDGKTSLTNIAVMLFGGLTAFKFLFGGTTLSIGDTHLALQALDLSSVLPMLIAVANYSHKRQILSNGNNSNVHNGNSNSNNGANNA